MIVLDKWESQFIWYSKGWLASYCKDNALEEPELDVALRNMWAERCGLRAKHTHISYVARALYHLVEKCQSFNHGDTFSFIENMAIQYRFTNGNAYEDNWGYYKRVCWIALYNYLSTLQILGDDEVLVELQPFEPELFLTKEED